MLSLPHRRALLGRSSAFDPLSLGPLVWHDYSDLSTMFTDVAGTTPVASDGDAIALHLDKSGNGNHLFQSDATKRFIWRAGGGKPYAESDGVDDIMSTAGNVALGGLTAVTLANGDMIRATTLQVEQEFGIAFSQGPQIFRYATAGHPFGFVCSDAVPTYVSRDTSAFGAANTAVEYVVVYDISQTGTNQLRAYSGGSELTLIDVYIGELTGTFASLALNVGARAGSEFPANARYYQRLVYPRALTTDEIQKVSAFIRSKMP
jgi:glutathione S-transferase